MTVPGSSAAFEQCVGGSAEEEEIRDKPQDLDYETLKLITVSSSGKPSKKLFRNVLSSRKFVGVYLGFLRHFLCTI